MVALKPKQAQVLTFVSEQLDKPRNVVIEEALDYYIKYINCPKASYTKPALDDWQQYTQKIIKNRTKKQKKFNFSVADLDISDAYLND